MKLIRCTCQGPKSLEEFYSDLTQESGSSSLCSESLAMLSLIARMRAWPIDDTIWGLTSLQWLMLLAHDNYETPWYVSVWAINYKNYEITYAIPQEIAPWSGARVKGEARSEDEALKMIQIGLEKSGFWQDLEKET